MPSEVAGRYHAELPERVRSYLRNVRGISDDAINHHLLGWDGHRIAIPIFNRDGLFSFFKLAKDPEDTSDNPKMVAPPGTKAELYGWERVLAKPERIVICEGEFDRLVLESRGIAAVTSTGGAMVFRREWAEKFKAIPDVYLAFDNDTAGRAGAERVARLIPQARLVFWPAEIGEGGDVTDYFVRLGKSREDFMALLEAAEVLPSPPPLAAPVLNRPRPRANGDAAQLKNSARIEDVIARYIGLRPSGENLAARCPFHEDHIPSFVVYPGTQSFYCFGCQAHGDVFTFLMRKEQLTFPQAVERLKQLIT